jgi:hypothetical protein
METRVTRGNFENEKKSPLRWAGRGVDAGFSRSNEGKTEARAIPEAPAMSLATEADVSRAGASPSITLVVPSYNQAEYLDECLESIAAQRYPNLDLRVMDGGSTDGTMAVLERHAGVISKWKSEKDDGHYPAINEGFADSHGEIMGWLNSDDVLMPGCLRVVGEIFQAFPQVEWLTTMTPMFLDCAGTLQGAGRICGFAKEAFLEGLYLPPKCPLTLKVGGNRVSIQQESTFWRRSLWNKAGGRVDTRFSLAGDFYLWSVFFEHADLYGTPSPLAAFRYRSGQRSGDLAQYVAEAERALREMRERQRWTERKRHRRLLFDLMCKVPILDAGLAPHLAFAGMVIRRNDPGSPDSEWCIFPHKFREP